MADKALQRTTDRRRVWSFCGKSPVELMVTVFLAGFYFYTTE
jgi:hypothetical protein